MGIYIPNTDDWQNPSEYALVFKGTTEFKDWIANVVAWKTNFAPNMDAAMRLGRAFCSSHSQKVTFIGHSKGGGEAIAAAAYTLRDAITFNAANFFFEGYHLTGQGSTIDNYYIGKEVLSSTIGPAAIGTTHWLEPQYWIDKTYKGGGYSISTKLPDQHANHSMDAIFRAFEHD